MDGSSVDLVFLFLLPQKARPDDLNVLAFVAQQLRSPAMKAVVRASTGTHDLNAALTFVEP